MTDTKWDVQPHDALVQALLAEPAEAAAVLRSLLPAALVANADFSTLRREPGTFVDEDLRKSTTDLLFTLRLRSGHPALVYVVLEHQSTADALMPWRLLRYVVRVLESWQRANPTARKLPPVVPVVLYHGSSKWTEPTAMLDVFDLPAEVRPALEAHLPSFRFLLDDLAVQSDEVLRGRALGAVGTLLLLSLKHGRTMQDPLRFFAGVAALMRDVLQAPSGFAALVHVLRYHLVVNERVDPGALGRLLEVELGEEAREVLMTAGEKLFAEGEARGRERGRQEGRREGEARLLLRLFRLRYGNPAPEVVARIEAASLTDLERWAERILTAESVAELFAEPPG